MKMGQNQKTEKKRSKTLLALTIVLFVAGVSMTIYGLYQEFYKEKIQNTPVHLENKNSKVYNNSALLENVTEKNITKIVKIGGEVYVYYK